MIDLTKELTVFILKSGNNPNYEDCLEALGKQSCLFTLNKIIDYSPMSVAMQEMLNRVKTPYFIQIDEDMILYPDTIEKMYKTILWSDNNTSMMSFMLKDVHLNMAIYGVKIYRSEILKKYPYNLKHPSCEVEQIERMEKDEYFNTFNEQIVGLHAPKWTPELIYSRYYNLAMKWRIYKYNWMQPEKLGNKLSNIYSNNKSSINWRAVCGYRDALLEESVIAQEKGIL